MKIAPLLLLLTLPAVAQEEHSADRAALEAEFARKMTGCRMVGTFTDSDRPGQPPEEDGYTIKKVTKLESGQWRFESIIKFREYELAVPIVLDVEWAGDTPVIQVTDLPVPGLGTYTARVLVYGDEYAGTWDGGSHGGHMFGRIERETLDPPTAHDTDGDTDGDSVLTVNWPSFRGPGASGVARGFQAPESWDIESGSNIAWRTPIPGMAHSSPVVWDQRVFLTTSVGESEDDPELKVGLYGSVKSVPDEGPQRFQVLCVDKTDGAILWTKTAFEGQPRYERHPKGSFAASTPATDGENVVAFFGTEGLYCYGVDGELRWKRDLGDLDSGWYVMKEARWGFSSSPVIHGDRVLVQCDVQSGSYVAALDLATGEDVWRTERDEVPGWGSPTVHVGSDGTQVILNGYKHIGSYDLADGKEIWWLKGGGDIPVPTPVVAGDLVYITNAHGQMAPIYAIRLDAYGEIEMGGDAMAWSTRRRGNYMQTPVAYGEYLYTCHDSGALRCYVAKTGEELWSERLGSGKAGFTASGIAVDGKLYFTSEDGEVHVVKAGPEFAHLAVNDMGEESMASPAASDGLLIWRTRRHLVAIGGE